MGGPESRIGYAQNYLMDPLDAAVGVWHSTCQFAATLCISRHHPCAFRVPLADPGIVVYRDQLSACLTQA